MNHFTAIDYVIFILLMVGGIWGAIKGFMSELSTKFGFILGFLFAIMFTHLLIPFFENKVGFPGWAAAFLSYFLFFMTGFMLMKGLGGVLSKIVDTANLTVVDNILGFFLGLAEAFIILAAVEYILGYQNVFNLQHYFDESLFSSKLLIPFAKACTSLISNAVSGV